MKGAAAVGCLMWMGLAMSCQRAVPLSLKATVTVRDCGLPAELWVETEENANVTINGTLEVRGNAAGKIKMELPAEVAAAPAIWVAAAQVDFRGDERTAKVQATRVEELGALGEARYASNLPMVDGLLVSLDPIDAGRPIPLQALGGDPAVAAGHVRVRLHACHLRHLGPELPDVRVTVTGDVAEVDIDVFSRLDRSQLRTAQLDVPVPLGAPDGRVVQARIRGTVQQSEQTRIEALQAVATHGLAEAPAADTVAAPKPVLAVDGQHVDYTLAGTHHTLREVPLLLLKDYTLQPTKPCGPYFKLGGRANARDGILVNRQLRHLHARLFEARSGRLLAEKNFVAKPDACGLLASTSTPGNGAQAETLLVDVSPNLVATWLAPFR